MAALAFQPSNVTVNAGTVVFFLVNGEEPLPADADVLRKYDRMHEFALAGSKGLTIALSGRVEPQRAVAMTIEALPPGSYTFACTLHGQLKMRGTLEVTA
jgi:plastocyanin